MLAHHILINKSVTFATEPVTTKTFYIDKPTKMNFSPTKLSGLILNAKLRNVLT